LQIERSLTKLAICPPLQEHGQVQGPGPPYRCKSLTILRPSGALKGSLTPHLQQYWPQKGIDLKNKRIAVIGTGASGVQTIQETGKDAAHLTVYQRTPNYALPMNQRPINEIENERQKKEGDFDKAFKNVYTTFAGFNYDFDKKNTFDVTPEEREKFYHWLLVDNGGFMFWLANYDDTYKNREANLEVCAEKSHCV